MIAEVTRDGSVLNEAQRQRILGAVLSGPIVELLRKTAHALPPQPKTAAKEADYALKTDRGLAPMRVDIPVSGSSSPAGIGWPGSQLTYADQRRIATVCNTTHLPMTHVLHHAVVFTHYVFRALMLEVMATQERTGTPVRDLLGAVIDGVGEEPGAQDAGPATLPTQPCAGDLSSAATSRSRAPIAVDPVTEDAGSVPASVLAEADPTRPFPDPLPPPPMPRPTAEPRPNAAPTADQIASLNERMESLEHEIRSLRESNDVLRTAIDDLREEVVHALRNQPEPPPPLHIHSLALDPTADDFADRVNAVPPDVMTRLRAEARNGRAKRSSATAAEGRPNEPSILDGGNGRTHAPERQKKLFS